jgi:hypothetical protein
MNTFEVMAVEQSPSCRTEMLVTVSGERGRSLAIALGGRPCGQWGYQMTPGRASKCKQLFEANFIARKAKYSWRFKYGDERIMPLWMAMQYIRMMQGVTATTQPAKELIFAMPEENLIQ